jgi:NAD(P)-dependent dehydrogenase (short-subunit alcohol dehydrogenase family)
VHDELFAVRGKVALVTGGTSGIGLMIARGLLQRGVTTYIVGRDAAQSRALATELSGDSQCVGLCADLAEPSGPSQLAADFARHEPRLHLLINNAGANETRALESVSVADWDRVLDVNLRAAFFLIQQLLPQLRAAATAADPARIINIGSIGGLHIPNWDAFPYGASKAALHHLTRALTKRLGSDNITVNAVAPGPFPSRLTDVESAGVKKSVETYVPLRRHGQPEDIEGLIVFLASRAGAYVNGATIPLDGGYIAAL